MLSSLMEIDNSEDKMGRLNMSRQSEVTGWLNVVSYATTRLKRSAAVLIVLRFVGLFN